MYSTIKEPGWKIASKIKNGEIIAEEYISSLFDWIEKKNRLLNAYTKIMKKAALEKAKQLDKKIRKGQSVGGLCGLGIAVKDNIYVKGVETTCATKALQAHIPQFSATVVEKIEKGDGIILGKTNMDEFALDGCSCYGYTLNPWNLKHYPGGSSCGSGATVASFMATLSLGSDTAGSVRNPASFCSLCGLKPTFGLVSRYGLIPLANTMDQIGPITRDVKDGALLLSYIAGQDLKDASTIGKEAEDYTKYLQENVEDLKIAVPKEFFPAIIQKSVEKTIWRAIHKLESLGANYSEISIKWLHHARSILNTILPVEAYPHLSIYATEQIGEDVKKLILIGHILTFKEARKRYEQATKLRTLLITAFERTFKKFDVLAGPTMLSLPFTLKKVKAGGIYPPVDVNRVPANLVGIPALSVPAGFYHGLPIGFQLMAPHFQEGLLFQIAYTYQKNSKHHLRMPQNTLKHEALENDIKLR